MASPLHRFVETFANFLHSKKHSFTNFLKSSHFRCLFIFSILCAHQHVKEWQKRKWTLGKNLLNCSFHTPYCGEWESFRFSTSLFTFVLELSNCCAWMVTIGRGYRRNVLVWFSKLPNRLSELKNFVMATRVATSTESVSLPKRNGPWTLHEGRVGDSKSSCCLNANLDRASEDISSKLWMGSIEMELRTCFRWLLRIFPSLSGNGRNGSPTGAY